ncbi:MAG: hypothetical protein GTO02_00015 [Candidatus Dadabacteria bacterium]|nr:hypothetical protein [Candidatus Dadabacteria bacterium]NIQ12835.1 hypothetical protein [Candidatus Dadabacteria bacterium]
MNKITAAVSSIIAPTGWELSDILPIFRLSGCCISAELVKFRLFPGNLPPRFPSYFLTKLKNFDRFLIGQNTTG